MEDLDVNPFFRALRTTHHDIWLAAGANQWLVIIPQASSLRGNIGRYDVESHILQPSRSFPGEFLTLQGNVVTVIGNEILTKSGFAEERRIKILYTEELKDSANYSDILNARASILSDGQATMGNPIEARSQEVGSQSTDLDSSTEVTFSIIHTAMPLIGGVNAPSSADEMERSVIVKYMAMLRSFPEHEPVMLRLDDFVLRTNQYLSENELPEDGSLEGFLKSELDHAVATLLNSQCFQSNLGNNSSLSRRKTSLELSQVLESYVLEGIHAKVFSRLSDVHAARDKELTRILDGMVEWTQSDLRMRAEFQCPLDSAIRALADLTLSSVTPLEKLLCLKRVHDSINRDVEKNLTSRYLDIGAHQMTTDDLLDQLIYAIVQARKREKDSAAIHAQVMRRRKRIQTRGSTDNLETVLSDCEDAYEIEKAHGIIRTPTSSFSRSQYQGSLQSYSNTDHLNTLKLDVHQQDLMSGSSQPFEGLYPTTTSRTKILNRMRKLSLKRSFLATNVAYMQQFHLVNLNTTILGYNLANLEVAIGWFLLRRGRVRGPLWACQEIEAPAALKKHESDRNIKDDDDSPIERRKHSTVSRESIVSFAGVRTAGLLMLLGEGGGDMLHHVGRRDHDTSEKNGLRVSLVANSSGVMASPDDLSRAKSIDRSRELRIIDMACSAHFFVKVDHHGRVWQWGVGLLAGRSAKVEQPDYLLEELLANKVTITTASEAHMASQSTRTAESKLQGDGKKIRPRASSELSEARIVGGLLRGRCITAVAVGMHHALCMDDAGRLFSWGDNRSGQLGVGIRVGLDHRSGNAASVKVPHGTSENLSEFTSGSNSPLPVDLRLRWEEKEEVGAIADRENVYIWGGGGPLLRATSIACGSSHSIVCTDEGRVFVWGRGKSGRLGLGERTHDRFLPTLLDISVAGGWGTSDRCVFVAGGWSHSLVVTACGMAFGWGCGADGRIGSGSYSDQLHPTRIHLYNDMFDYRHLDADEPHDDFGEDQIHRENSALDTADGEVTYSLKERERPLTQYDDPIRKAAAGYAHSAFLTSSGTLYTCGCGVSGQLARFENIKINTDASQRQKHERAVQMSSEMIPTVVSLVPRPVQWSVHRDGLSNMPVAEDSGFGVQDHKVVVVDVACGDHHTVAVSASGDLYSWGLNQAGQCGIQAEQSAGAKDSGKNEEQLTPSRATWIQERYGEDAVVVKVCCGPSTTAAVIIE